MNLQAVSPHLGLHANFHGFDVCFPQVHVRNQPVCNPPVQVIPLPQAGGARGGRERSERSRVPFENFLGRCASPPP